MQTEIYLELIDPNPWQPRQRYTEIEELAEDIYSRRGARPETYGLLQLPAVRIVDGDGEPIEVIDLSLIHI